MATTTQYEKISTEDIEAVTTAQEANKMSEQQKNRTSEEEDRIAAKKWITFLESGPPTMNLPEALLKTSSASASNHCVEYQDMTSHGDSSELRIVKPLKMEIGLGESPIPFRPVLSQIEKLSDGRLWLFDELTISPPTSQLKERLYPGKNRSSKLNVFIAPNPNELRELAMGADGSLKRLNDEQHIEIRQKGTFSVPSKNFPGAVHVWRITQLLQRGNEPANDDFRGLIARAYYFTFIVARNRVIGRVLSLKDAIENIGYAFHFVYNSLIGGQIRNPNYDLTEEMFQQLTEDLQVADPNQLENFARKLLKLCKSSKVNLFQTKRPLNSISMTTAQNLELEKLAPNLYSSRTSGDKINLFAVSPSWIRNREEEIFGLVTRLTKYKYPPKRVQQLIREYRDDGMTDNQIVERIKSAFDDEYLTALISALRESAIENKIFTENGEEVIETYLRGLVTIQDELRNEELRISKVLEETHDSLVENNSIRSKCNDWLNEKMDKARKVAEQNENSFQNAVQKLGENEAIGPEWGYFIRRSEEFHDSLPETIARLNKHHYTTHQTVFRKWIWKPTNYIVTNVKTGKRKKDVKIVEHPIKNNQYIYSMVKKQEITVTSEYPGWRLRKYFVSFYTWFLNFLFFLLVGMILKGPFSLSALFLWYKYPTNYELDYFTGNVYPSHFSNTFVTLLLSLWRNIIRRRTEFEQKPDTGFLPKNLTRVLNRFWLYVIYGFFGTLIFSLVFPTLCLLLVIIGIVLLITIPIWYVALSIIIILFRTLIYDFQYEDGTDRNPGGKVFPLFYLVVYKLGVRITLQLLVSLLIIIFMPILSLLTILIACIRRSLRFTWDLFMYVVVIKPRGRVPITNSFVARRIAGPGLATNYYYQIHPSQALIKFEYGLEMKELELYQRFIRELLNQPSETYSKFINNILKPLGYNISSMDTHNPSIVRISKQKKNLGKILNEKMSERYEDFHLDSPNVSVDRIRMVKSDLDSTIRFATQIIEEFYTKRILVYPDQDREKIFSGYGLETNDWEGLAKINLNDSFSSSFLTPLEDSDESFCLHVEKLGLDDYFEALGSGQTLHDLDRDRMITVDKHYTFLPGIHLEPKYDLNWARSNCINLGRIRYGKKKRRRANVPKFLHNDFNNKLQFAVKLAARVGWTNILGDDEDNVDEDPVGTEV